MWEARDRERHYTSSKVMSWVALDRAVGMAHRIGASEQHVSRWIAERDAVHAAVLEEAWSESEGAFAGAFGSTHLDASVLLMPLVGFLDANEPRMRSTIEAIEAKLGTGALVRRWQDEPNGFLLTSFWLVRCLARLGQIDRARERFEALLSFGNDLGLLPEEGDPGSGLGMGNVPQAFSHVGLINAAWELTLAQRAAAGDG
jgi:GH15 family glucan-1,4-alpha-glucosidase